MKSEATLFPLQRRALLHGLWSAAAVAGLTTLGLPAAAEAQDSSSSRQDSSLRRIPAVGREVDSTSSVPADSTSTVRVGRDTTGDSTRFGVNAEEERSTEAAAPDTLSSRDSTDSSATPDVVHQKRHVPPGVGHEPPPYPADSERIWLQERPSNDSVPVPGDTASDSAPSEP